MNFVKINFININLNNINTFRGFHRDFGMGGPKGGDKGPMGGDWRVIRDKIKGTKKMSVNL